MRPTWIVVALLTLTACDATAGPQVPSVQQPKATGSAAPQAQETDYDKALRFTRCMNDALATRYPGEGKPIPDPVEGKPLQTFAAVPWKGAVAEGGALVSTGSESGWLVTVPEIFDLCKGFLPTTWPVKMDAAEIARSRAFDECMRRHGIDIPIPDANGVARVPTNPSYAGTPEYSSAESACRKYYDDPANALPENQ